MKFEFELVAFFSEFSLLSLERVKWRRIGRNFTFFLPLVRELTRVFIMWHWHSTWLACS